MRSREKVSSLVRDWLNPIFAYGGDISYYGNYAVHTFKADANFIVLKPVSCDVLIIAGGGGGGTGAPGSGGAGGMYEILGLGIEPGSWAAVIGVGGPVQTNGGDTTFKGYTALGGGKGADGGGSAGSAGGSGGGGGNNYGQGGAGTAGPPLQGYKGGASTWWANGGGGGGAGGIGGDGSGTTAGNGGLGRNSSIPTGSAVKYAGGGAGWGWDTMPAAPEGGGGIGGIQVPIINATAGTPNTGGGGGPAQAGGSGIVVIRYLLR